MIRKNSARMDYTDESFVTVEDKSDRETVQTVSDEMREALNAQTMVFLQNSLCIHKIVLYSLTETLDLNKRRCECEIVSRETCQTVYT